MARTTNYNNRRVSLSIYSSLFNYNSDFEQQAPTSLNSPEGGFVVAGIAKLCQSVLVTLLSDQVVFDSSWGSALPRYMTGSVQSIAANLEGIMTGALAEVRSQLKEHEAEDAPDDERVDTLEMSNWAYSDDGAGLTMTISVTSVAGDTRDVIVPLNISV